MTYLRGKLRNPDYFENLKLVGTQKNVRYVSIKVNGRNTRVVLKETFGAKAHGHNYKQFRREIKVLQLATKNKETSGTKYVLKTPRV